MYNSKATYAQAGVPVDLPSAQEAAKEDLTLLGCQECLPYVPAAMLLV